MLGYKIAKSFGKRVVITLEIPEDAITNVKRSNIVKAETASYRTNKAIVIKIEDSDGNINDEAESCFYDKKKLIYSLGKQCACHDFDMNLEIASGAGIHFVLSKSLAETYGLVRIENGILTSWHNNGVKESEITFVNNKKHGLYCSWHENGNKNHEYNVLNDKKDGLCIEWYENGNKKHEYTIVNRQLNGLHTEWYENGNKKKESTFVNGKIDELFNEWNENGDKTCEHTYGNKHGDEEQPVVCCIIA